MDGRKTRRQFAVGAEVSPSGVDFRVWAPRVCRVDVVIGSKGSIAHTLSPEADDYYSAFIPHVGPGTRYRFQLDEDREWPDPASRFQPEGPTGPSEIVDSASFEWNDAHWSGISAGDRQVLYELHIGTFTKPGTWSSAIEQLPALKDLGITAIEVMPIAEFPGRFGWGYDGVNLFAPSHLYGPPDDARRFVDAAHTLGLGVILDVVYNHFGPKDNTTGAFSASYLSKEHMGEWGAAMNFDGEANGPVREFFVANARHWIEEYHFDGLRFDATQAIIDRSAENILSEITRRVRAAVPGRSLYFIGENEPQHSKLVVPVERGGSGLDSLWNEDFHHVAMIAATGRREGYYRDYRGNAQEVVSMAKHGFLYQGQVNTRQGKRRGKPTTGLEAERFVLYLQNHDQVANTPRGSRIHDRTSPARLRALTALWLLVPGTPMFFQGQEFASASPFLYFCDYDEPLCEEVRRGRQKFLSQFASLDDAEGRDALPEPCAPWNFEHCKIDHRERERHAATFALHRDLLALRRQDRVIHARHMERFDGIVLGDRAVAFRDYGLSEGDRLVLVNFGDDLAFGQSPDPLLAPPEGGRWRRIWSSESVRYDGDGTPLIEPDRAFRLPGSIAVVFASEVDEGPTHD